MNFSYHPKYEFIAKNVKSFLDENLSENNGTNFIVGGDGTLFVYADFNKPNFLISSHKYSFGYYSACFFEDDYQEKLLKYLNNPKFYQKEYGTIEVRINGKPLPERAINDVMIGKDYFFKANISGVKTGDTGLLYYTPHGCNAWAAKHGGIIYDSIGCVLMDMRQPIELTSPLEIEVLEFHDLDVMIDGKGNNLNKYYKHTSSKLRKDVYTKPWSFSNGDVITISKGKPVSIVKM
jgi:hypothetical protein